MTRNSDPATRALVLTWTYGVGIVGGVLRADDAVLHAMEEAVATAQRDSSDSAVIFAEYALGGTLLYREDAIDRGRGLKLMKRSRDEFRRRVPCLVPATDVMIATDEMANLVDSGAAIAVMRTAVDALQRAGRLPGAYGVYGASTFLEALLARGSKDDLGEAQEGIDRFANLAAQKRWAMLDIMLLRLRTLLARARGDDIAYKELASQYREMAESLGFEGHTAWAEAMDE